jgi:Flp pilus assembly protein TadB
MFQRTEGYNECENVDKEIEERRASIIIRCHAHNVFVFVSVFVYVPVSVSVSVFVFVFVFCFCFCDDNSDRTTRRFRHSIKSIVDRLW